MNRTFVFGGDTYKVVSEKKILIGIECYFILANQFGNRLYLTCLPED